MKSLLSITAIVGFSAALYAQPITIANSSFEAQSPGYVGAIVTGWTGAQYAQILAPGANITGLTGSNGILIGGNGISQTTAATFLTGAIYTLTMDVGLPTGTTDTAGTFHLDFNAATTHSHFLRFLLILQLEQWPQFLTHTLRCLPITDCRLLLPSGITMTTPGHMYLTMSL